MRCVLVTGATGLVGGDVVARLLGRDDTLRVVVLVRDAQRWGQAARSRGIDARRVRVLTGDVQQPMFGLAKKERQRLRDVTHILHAAADTSFSQPLLHARSINVDGTRRMLELACELDGLQRFAHVSTAFVAGKRCGEIAEGPATNDRYVNAYEQSKHEAEQVVMASALPWLIARLSTIVSDDVSGHVRQINSVHRALRLCHHGMAAMLPGARDAPMDLITADYASEALTRLLLDTGDDRQVLHLCAGVDAAPLGALIDQAFDVWARTPDWHRRGITPPAFVQLETYRKFEESVELIRDARLLRITRALSHFVPQLALPKRFSTLIADARLGIRPPNVLEYWPLMVASLSESYWPGSRAA